MGITQVVCMSRSQWCGMRAEERMGKYFLEELTLS